MLAEENVEKRIPPHPISSHGIDYYLRVKGDSMIDVGIFENDLIAVNKDLNIKGSIVIARIDDEVTVKTLKLSVIELFSKLKIQTTRILLLTLTT